MKGNKTCVSCENCTMKNNIDECINTPCTYHESFIANYLKEAFFDVLNKYQNWYLIKYLTDLPKNRCKEIEDLFTILSKDMHKKRNKKDKK